MSVIAKKKLGNAIIRNKIKRRIKEYYARCNLKTVKINCEYSYLIIAKKMFLMINLKI